jgi:hypothetical protein
MEPWAREGPKSLSIGAFFAAYQLADLRRQRRREAVLALVRSFQSAHFTSALRQTNSLPDGADRATIRELLGPTGENQVFLVGLTWESLGVLVFRRQVDMETMDDFFSGAIMVSWRKLSKFVEEDRELAAPDGVGMVPVAGRPHAGTGAHPGTRSRAYRTSGLAT